MNRPSTSLPLAGCLTTQPDQLDSAKMVFVGLPDDGKSSYLRGTAKAPAQIRDAYDGDCHNPTTETGVDLSGLVADLGDLPAQPEWEETYRSYRGFAETLYRGGKIPFFAGGDHSVTVPVVEALSTFNHPIHFIQIDAHPDLYPDYDGDPYSNACVAARIIEMEHIVSVTQIGIRTMNGAQQTVAEKFQDRLEILHARQLTAEIPPPSKIPQGAAVYISIDVDGLDPAYAPGVSHPEPGGLSTRQVLNFLQNGCWALVGMDVVEVNPDLDVNHQTSVLAGKLFHEAMGYAFKQLNRQLP